MRPLILISNDDGYEAKGINELIDMVRETWGRFSVIHFRKSESRPYLCIGFVQPVILGFRACTCRLPEVTRADPPW